MASNESLIDMNLLNETAELGIDDLGELIELYLDQATEIMEDLQTAIDKNHARDVMELSHRLAGSSAACGASGVMNTLRQLEQCGREQDLADADSLFSQAVDQLKETERLISEYLDPKGAALRASFVPPQGR